MVCRKQKKTNSLQWLLYVTPEHKSRLKSGGIFIAIVNDTSYGTKLLIFLLSQKSLDIKIMFHEDIL